MSNMQTTEPRNSAKPLRYTASRPAAGDPPGRRGRAIGKRPHHDFPPPPPPPRRATGDGFDAYPPSLPGRQLPSARLLSAGLTALLSPSRQRWADPERPAPRRLPARTNNQLELRRADERGQAGPSPAVLPPLPEVLSPLRHFGQALLQETRQLRSGPLQAAILQAHEGALGLARRLPQLLANGQGLLQACWLPRRPLALLPAEDEPQGFEATLLAQSRALFDRLPHMAAWLCSAGGRNEPTAPRSEGESDLDDDDFVFIEHGPGELGKAHLP